MVTLKTQENDASVDQYINSLDSKKRQDEARQVLSLMEQATGAPPRMWGDSIIGFGRYHYRYESGREGTWFVTGFAPRKRELVVYIMPGYADYSEPLARLGKHRKGKSCLYLSRLAAVDIDVLREIIVASIADMQNRYECELS